MDWSRLAGMKPNSGKAGAKDGATTSGALAAGIDRSNCLLSSATIIDCLEKVSGSTVLIDPQTGAPCALMTAAIRDGPANLAWYRPSDSLASAA